MATTITQFKDSIISYGGDEVADIATDGEALLEYVNNALVNRHEEVCALMNKWGTATITMAADGYEYALPTDWDWVSEIELYSDSDKNENYDDFKVKHGVIRFDTKQPSGQIYYERYRKAPNVYTAASQTMVEADNPRLKKILMEEVIAMYLSSQNDLEASPAESNALGKGNRNA